MFAFFKSFKKLSILMIVFAVLINHTTYAEININTYSLPGVGYGLKSITHDSDGAMWFTESINKKLGKITADGVISEYDMPNNSRPSDIVVGPDNAVWFTLSGRIARTNNGDDITVYPNTTADDVRYLTSGPDNAVWFTEYWNNSWGIGRIDTFGNVTHYPLPNEMTILDITAGSDGALWFIEYSNDTDSAIGRITVDGHYSSYLIPTYASYPSSITSGPDGNLWFTETNAGKVGRLTTNGVFTEYDTPHNAHTGSGITAGPDGAVWFNYNGVDSIGRITMAGEITDFPLPVGNLAIASDGTDGIWFVNYSNDTIGRLKLDLKPTAPVGLVSVTPAKSAMLTWNSVTNASSYQIFRDSVNIGTSTQTSFNDNVASDGSHSYYVSAVSSANITSDPSNKIDVLIDNAKPLIASSITTSPNNNGWNNSNVAVAFACNDNISGIQTCSLPVTLTTEGANQQISGIAVDNAGNSTSMTTKVNIDKTAPTISSPTMSNTLVLGSSNETLSAKASDVLSGVSGGEYYVDTDPGQGRGSEMTYASGTLRAITTIKTITTGQHKLYMRSKDAAGNWSNPVSVNFTGVIGNTALNAVQNIINNILKSIVGLLLR